MRRKFVVLTLCLILTGLNANAAVITTSATNPVVDTGDIAQLGTCGGTESLNVSTNDQYTYVANDRTTQGQTFTSLGSGTIKGFSLRNPTYWGWTNVADGDSFTVRVCSVSGTALTVLRSEVATVAAGNAIGYNQGGTGKWLHIALASPVVLAANTTYAFDITSYGPCIEIDGLAANPYAGGSAYTTGETTASKEALVIGALHGGDRTFIVDIEPTIRPDVPTPGAVSVELTQDLSWTVLNPNVTLVDLYFGTVNDPNLSLIPANKKLSMVPAANVTWDTALLPAGKMEYNTTYYWKVDAYEPNGMGGYTKLGGGVSSFTTVGQTAAVGPVSPAKTVEYPEADINLTVTAANTTLYQWYKVATPADVILSDGADYLGVNTNTLTIKDLQDTDQGSYYCQVDNDLPGTEPVNSVPGVVVTKRLIIYYPLDTVDGSSTPDTIGSYNMTLKSDDSGADLPSLVAGVPQLGVDGKALLFDNRGAADPNFWGQYATAGDVDMETIGNGLTIAFWAQWIGNNTNWQGIINRRGTWSGADMMWRIDKDPTSGAISFAREGAGGSVSTTLTQGAWHQITATFDAVSGKTKIYNNGELIDTQTGFTFGTGVSSGFKLGANNDDGSDFFYGKIDDVKVYNYARTSVEIANDYVDVMGGWVCNNEGADGLTNDFNDDCKVDMEDFAILAKDWLNSNLVTPQP